MYNDSMSEIHVRPITSDDFLPVAALLAELGRPALTPESSDAAWAVYERHLTDPQTASLVAEVDGSLSCSANISTISTRKAGFPT